MRHTNSKHQISNITRNSFLLKRFTKELCSTQPVSNLELNNRYLYAINASASRIAPKGVYHNS